MSRRIQNTNGESLKVPDLSAMQSLLELYIQGASIDWNDLYRHCFYRKVALPTYPFQRQRYWI
ncbi:MAG: hypothetical protein HC820_04410 [Hydrococcus sp. RM1_1_31]|nr:hypothetical protein [Hydrococcus sp. RM1_1_31]